jgi:tetratricopeptide (TPR) repeat protein
MNVFIVRPFGEKEGINFNEVENLLIQPALKSIDVHGSTTGEIVKAGNIRHDMFQLLLVADLVIADISIHNANVFYELGIRHALRDKRTIMIRCGSNEVPFDLKTDRYLSYDKNDPAESLPILIQSLQDTIASQDKDSPVFQLLPDLEAQDQSRFIVVPKDFQEEVDLARIHQWQGDLKLLAEEVQGLFWAREGFRIIGRVQFKLQDYEGGRDTWEQVRKVYPDDLEANLLLGTIYQRLGDLACSDQAIERVLSQKYSSTSDRAEAYALRGRNSKIRWQADWLNSPEPDVPQNALRSPHLLQAFTAYEQGYLQDLNHYYSGINALALLVVLTDLAARFPEVWVTCFDEDDEAIQRLKYLGKRCTELASAVTLSLKAEKDRLTRSEQEDVWFDITCADLRCLTLTRPERVAQAYRTAFHKIDPFSYESAAQQLQMLQTLGVRKDNVQAAVQEITVLRPTAERKEKKEPHVLLFTGHMIDQDDREQPRFPAAKESAVRQEIEKHVAAELSRVEGELIGVTGCACGGDILFHEVCADLGIVTKIYLALPKDQYIVTSVQHGGPQWVDRFNQLNQRLDSRILSPTKELPRWLREKNNYSLWQRNNLWTFYNGLALGGANMSLIALWDGRGGDGPGGTEDMVEHARSQGAKVIIIDINTICS